MITLRSHQYSIIVHLSRLHLFLFPLAFVPILQTISIFVELRNIK